MMGKDEGFFLLMLDCFFVVKKLLRKVAATGSSSCFFFLSLKPEGLRIFSKKLPPRTGIFPPSPRPGEFVSHFPSRQRTTTILATGGVLVGVEPRWG